MLSSIKTYLGFFIRNRKPVRNTAVASAVASFLPENDPGKKLSKKRLAVISGEKSGMGGCESFAADCEGGKMRTQGRCGFITGI
ncbi:hypothetical protein CHL67_03735 [Prosthecochloris sp. GSB1]|nr:hypothetical protein CHL67_03735 [Prosthecochloris sp. GSB1]